MCRHITLCKWADILHFQPKRKILFHTVAAAPAPEPALTTSDDRIISALQFFDHSYTYKKNIYNNNYVIQTQRPKYYWIEQRTFQRTLLSSFVVLYFSLFLSSFLIRNNFIFFLSQTRTHSFSFSPPFLSVNLSPIRAYSTDWKQYLTMTGIFWQYPNDKFDVPIFDVFVYIQIEIFCFILFRLNQ